MKQIIEIKKNCDHCVKRDVCKFLSQYKSLVNSNEFYGMFEYLEWNNLEALFKDNAFAYKCFKAEFNSGELTQSLPLKIWEKIYRIHLEEKGYSLWQTASDGVLTVKDKQGNLVTTEMLAEKYELLIVNKLTVS